MKLFENIYLSISINFKNSDTEICVLEDDFEDKTNDSRDSIYTNRTIFKLLKFNNDNSNNDDKK